ncbi:MAG: AAA family ATPase, partial [Nitrospiraceae bacterium]
ASTYNGRDPQVERLREVERQLTTLTATDYKSTYPDIMEAKQEIESLKMQLAEKYGDTAGENDRDTAKTYDVYLQELIKQKIALRAEVSSLQERSRRLTGQITQFEHRVEQTPAREQEVMILMRDYENMQKNYQALLDKRLNAHVAENLEKRQKGEQFRILDPANLPQKVDSPNRLLIMMLGLVGGCGLGVGVAVGRDRLFPTFKRRQEVERLPGIRVLATIPDFVSMKDHLHVKLPVENSRVRRTSANRAEALLADRNLVAKRQPLSMAAEQYRMAATSLVLSTERSDATIVEITSALKGEGKTTTVVNLGYTLAKDLGKRTLLIDCDFRCPALHHYVSMPARAGLIELLDEQALFEDCLSAIDEVPCSILAVGGASGEEHNELTRIQQLREILPKLRKHYDYIIINTPPVLSSATMGILASLADVLILVIRAGATPKHIVQQAFMMLRLKTEALVILNAVETQSLPGHIYFDNPTPPGGDQSIKARPRKVVPLNPVNDHEDMETPKWMNVPLKGRDSGW